MAVRLLGVGVATPQHQLDQEAALALAQQICCSDERQSRLASALYKHAGIATRYTALPFTEAYRWAPPDAPRKDDSPNFGPTTQERMEYYEQHALPLGVQAATQAIEAAGIPRREITHVVTASCTGFTAPGVDSGLIQSLELRPTTQRIHVGYMGCHGAINALRVARGLAHSEPEARVLVCAVELCSLHYAFHWDSERMLGNALFADGAGALVVGGVPDSTALDPSRHWSVAATGSYLFPGTAAAMTWRVGNHGFAMTISSQLPHLLQQHLSGWLTGWLDDHGLRAQNIRSWAVHPGGPRILEAVASSMGLPADCMHDSRQVLSRYGNMSSATVLFILKSLIGHKAAAPCVMLGFGPGLVAEAALLLE
jgi:predicted naringenin-chalcone synthase